MASNAFSQITQPSPLELAIRIKKAGDAGDAPLRVSAEVKQLGLDAGPFDFAVPLDDKGLDELRWYLELYPHWPVGPDYDRAQLVEARLREWGKQLFDAVFQSKMMRVYEQFRLKADGGTITLDATDARVLRLPWELLADEGGYLYTQRPPIGLRRKLPRAKVAKTQPFVLPVRILMVVSRPDDVSFLDPRSSSAALLDAVEPMGDQVQVEFLYPSTLKALATCIRDGRQPPVHVVHFDGHGVYDAQTGLGYLVFETDAHAKNLVNADDLGTLLNDTGVPLMVLDACQTAQADQANPFGSVAARLIESGIGSVLAMNYSVLVPAARILTAAFYGALARGDTIGQAVDAARLAMLMDTARLSLYRAGQEETIHLRDWFLPALYQQREDVAPFSPTPTPPPRAGEGSRVGVVGVGEVPLYPARGGFPAEPRYGFYGREKELLHLRRTLAERPIVVLHGYGGQGKTTLAAHAARWFARTGLFQRAAFVSFERGGGLDYCLAELGNALVGDNFAIHQGDPAQAIADALRATPTLVVFDNFESILPNGDVALPDADLQKLLDAAAGWFPPPSRSGGGVSRLILTTRDPSLPHPSFEPGLSAAHTELPGLWLSDAIELTAQILKAYGIPRPGREKLAELLDFLGGHPLSIQLAVPHLRDYTPEQLVAVFDQLLPGFTSGAGKARNESLRVSLEFSLRRLGEDTRKLLPDLAVFQGGAMEMRILPITGWKIAAWRQVRDELARAGLLTVDQAVGLGIKTDEGDFGGHYVRFHLTLLPHLAARLEPARRAELEARYRQSYHGLASYLYQQDAKDPMTARAVAMRELPNLRRALDLMLAATDAAAPPLSSPPHADSLSSPPHAGGTEGGNLDAAADLADSIARFLNYFGRWSERDAVLAQVERARQAAGAPPSAGVPPAAYLALSNRGEQLLQAGRAAEAERIFRDLLARLGDGSEQSPPRAGGIKGGNAAPSYERAVTLGRLGRCLADQGQPGAAAEVYRQGLDVLAQLEQSDGVKRQTGVTHTNLADVLADIGQVDAARQEYEATLEIMQSIGADVGVTLGQLGTLALRQNDLAEARRRYLEALDSDRRRGEPQGEAIWWHQLGIVAEEAKDWVEAERCYKESLAISERMGNTAYAAQTCNQLAIVAKGAGRFAEAEWWYKRPLENTELLPDRGARVYSNLADLYLAQGRLDEAERYTQRAREIMETLDLSAEPWKTYSILAEIAEKRGRAAEARQWRRKAQQTRREFDECSGYQAYDKILQQFEGVIQGVVAAANGNESARKQVEALFDTFQKGNWQIVDAIQRIWNGERDDALIEGIDPNSGAIVRRILAVMEAPPPSPSPVQNTGEGEREPPSPVADGGRDGDGGQSISLEDLLKLVVAGARGDGQAGEQAFRIAQALQQPGAPPEYAALGQGFQRVLAGLRDQDAIAGLPEETAQIIQLALDNLD